MRYDRNERYDYLDICNSYNNYTNTSNIFVEDEGIQAKPPTPIHNYSNDHIIQGF